MSVAFDKYSVVTPNLPDATCLILEFMESPFGNGVKRDFSSPPSPVFDRPPSRFIAIAKVVCASVEIDPSDMAPVANLLTISEVGSTSSILIELVSEVNSNKPLKFLSLIEWSLIFFEYFLKVS